VDDTHLSGSFGWEEYQSGPVGNAELSTNPVKNAPITRRRQPCSRTTDLCDEARDLDCDASWLALLVYTEGRPAGKRDALRTSIAKSLGLHPASTPRVAVLAQITILHAGALFDDRLGASGIGIDQSKRPLVSMPLVAREAGGSEIGRHSGAKRDTLCPPVAGGTHDLHAVQTRLEQGAR
jgi:hypothetical protein